MLRYVISALFLTLHRQSIAQTLCQGDAARCSLEGALSQDLHLATDSDSSNAEATKLLQTEVSRRTSVQIGPKGEESLFQGSELQGSESSDEDLEVTRSKRTRSVARAGEATRVANSKSSRVKQSPARGTSKVGINLSVKWMRHPLRADQAIGSIATIQEYLQLSQPIEKVKTYDLSHSNKGIIQELLSNSSGVNEILVGIGNKDLKTVDYTWLENVANRFDGEIHLAVGNEPDRSPLLASPERLISVIKEIRTRMPNVKVTIPFAYSIMKKSHPIKDAIFEKEFIDLFSDVLPLLDYFTINIYPFLSAGTKGVTIDNLNGPDMSFLSEQLGALRVAMDKLLPNKKLQIAIGETGWPSCGAARAHPYAEATLSQSYRFLQNVARWFQGSASDGQVISGYLFTAFDEETKGTRAIEHAYGILTSNGTVKGPQTCTTNATEPSVGWLEMDYPDCESDMDWMVKNFDNVKLEEKFAGRDMDGSLCSFQQYLYDRWASCPPTARIPGDKVFFEGATGYGFTAATQKCSSSRLADKYSDRGSWTPPSSSHLADSLEPNHLKDSEEIPKSSAHGVSSLVQVHQSPGSPVTHDLHVYWINLDASSGRRSAMERMFQQLRKAVPEGINLHVTRVPAVGPYEVRAMEKNKSLTVEATLIDACTLACPVHHGMGQLLLHEMGCTLSHLRAIDMAYASNAEAALIIEDDVHIYDELLSDATSLLNAAPANWTALQMSTVSSKALLALASSETPFQTRKEHYYGTGAYFIRRSGMEVLRNRYATRKFQKQNPNTTSAHELQAEGVIFGSLPERTVQASAQFYFNFMDFPTTVHKMSNISEYYSVTSLRWQTHFVHHHRGGVQKVVKQMELAKASKVGPPKRLQNSTFLAMTTVICRNNSGFAGELRSMAANIRTMKPYHFKWVIYVIVDTDKEVGRCPGMSNYTEFSQPQVEVVYRVNAGRFSKWVYYTEDTEQFARYDYLVVYDADMGLSTFAWDDFFQRYDMYSARFGTPPIVGTVRNKSPFHPLRRDWWHNCSRKDIKFVEADFVEQWFAMLSGPFAAWYLKQVVAVGLVEVQKELGVDWGVDGSWCGAAAQWAKKEAGCLLIPIDMYHGDTKSLKQDVVFHQHGEHLTNVWWQRVPQWMLNSQIWLGTFFQDPSMVCSPCGVEERYHILQELRSQVPIVPTGVVAGSGHFLEGGGASSSLTDPGAMTSDSASGTAYAKSRLIEDRSGAIRLDSALLSTLAFLAFAAELR
eukprot:TRINITY_DN27102_c0_g1_i1.p1 TRINITY_DN27102_c0_g1~~TRINITY_DN27102_c0_g1_i1.p1  ORF type:complete len:1241 (-),score=230.91 TRINITY_DN27102_c0_g1_i1:186-3908(-)